MQDFTPPWALRNAHLMTIASAFWRRKITQLPPSETRLFETEPGTKVSAECHWQPNRHERPTLALLHGLEGSSESGYILGTAEKAYVAGFNVMRVNQRNCGGTERLTPTLYHSGLSCDMRAIVTELIERDGLAQIFAAGFSMGGNLVLKMAGEWGAHVPPQVAGFAAVCPAFDLATCADALSTPQNFIYEARFVRGLKQRMRRKAALFPEVYRIDGMKEIRTVRDFDEIITAKYCGFEGADDYYSKSSAMRLVKAIKKPTLIMTAQDDPFVPFASFEKAGIAENTNIRLLAPKYGGHCAFIASGNERFWAEARIVEFCVNNSQKQEAGA